jgi:protein TonB
MPLPEENELPELNPAFGDDSDQKQRRQMLIALALLLLALILVLVKDREFWFPPTPATAAESELAEPTETDTQTKDQAQGQAQPTAGTAKSSPGRPKSRPRNPQPAVVTPSPAPALAPVVTSRTVLPPLEVEVVAGDEHRTIQAGTNSVKVDLQPRRPIASTPTGAGEVADATGRVRVSAGAAQILSRPVEPNYPLLAKQMKVQGAVVLEALIGRDGNIQDLHILSGPPILSSAAREAVKQWRFKPFFESGQPVETEARITVNFTISTQ